MILKFIKNLETTSELLEDREEIEFSLIEEAGEILGILKKMKFHKHRNLSGLIENLKLELGDFLWYYIANVKINKKYTKGKIKRFFKKEELFFYETRQNGSNKKIQDFNKNIEVISLGEYFAEIESFVQKEWATDFEINFEEIMKLNIEKTQKRYQKCLI